MALRIIKNNLVSTATISANSEAQSAGYVATRWPSKQWVASSLTSAHLDFDFGATSTFDSLAIVNHTLAGASANASASVWVSEDDATYTRVAEIPFITSHAVLPLYTTTQNARYTRILMHDGFTGGIPKIGCVLIGEKFEPSSFNANELKLNMVNPSKSAVTEGGNIHIDKRTVYDTIQVGLRCMDKSELSNLRNVTQSAQGDPKIITLWSEDYASADDLTYYGALNINGVNRQGPSWTGPSLTVREEK